MAVILPLFKSNYSRRHAVEVYASAVVAFTVLYTYDLEL